MKRFYLFLVVCLTVFAFSMKTHANSIIELKGTLVLGQTRSLSTDDPIVAEEQETGVYTTFNRDLGDVIIEVVSYTTEETVFSTTVDSADGYSFIDLTNFDFDSGEYYIRYTTDYGILVGDL